MERRRFVTTLGAVLASGALWRAGRALAPSPDKLSRIGLQLYTVRRELQRDFDGTLATVASIGYREVEFAGYAGRSSEQVRAALDAHGLTAPAAHVDLATLEAQWERTVAAATVIGHRHLVVPWIAAAERGTLEAWRRVAQRFNTVGARARDAGLGFAYHNHDFEFVPIEGQLGFDVLLAETDPALVRIEMDLYWITKGGGDPLVYFARHPGRFPMVHVKDMAHDGRQTMVDVGKGAIDFKRIFAQRREGGIEHFFVEHDQPATPFESIRASYQYLKDLEF